MGFPSSPALGIVALLHVERDGSVPLARARPEREAQPPGSSGSGLLPALLSRLERGPAECGALGQLGTGLAQDQAGLRRVPGRGKQENFLLQRRRGCRTRVGPTSPRLGRGRRGREAACQAAVLPGDGASRLAGPLCERGARGAGREGGDGRGPPPTAAESDRVDWGPAL